MKKVINVIALVMLVSVNVLTPLTYAGDEIVESEVENLGEVVEALEDNGEISGNEAENAGEVGETFDNIAETPVESEIIPGNYTENDGEVEQGDKEKSEQEDDLLNIQNDGGNIEETQVIDETDSQENETDNNNEIQENIENDYETTEQEEQRLENEQENMDENLELEKNQEPITMGVISGTSVTLLPGRQFNERLKKIAGEGSAYTINSTIKRILWTGNIPSGVTTTGISMVGSEYPVYAWFAGGIVYYTTQAETIKMNGDSSYMFYYMQGLTGLDLSNWDTSNVTDMSKIFSNCKILKSLNVSNWNTSNVTGMYNMFQGCNALKGLDVSNWDTKNVIDMGSMFSSCNSLDTLDLSNWDTRNVTDMSTMFYSCGNLTGLNLSGWNTSNLRNVSRMFEGCYGLISLDLSNWNTSNVTNMSSMFKYCSKLTNLKLSNWDTSNVTNMSSMFLNCGKVSGLDISNWNVGNVTSMNSMFQGCSNLTGLDLSNWNTKNVTNMNSMFNSCTRLESIYVSTGFIATGVTNSDTMFSYDAKIIGGNGTKFDSEKIDKTYALIDKLGQTGYFTDKNAISVVFFVDQNISHVQTLSFGDLVEKPANPIKTGSTFIGWQDKNGEDFDFNNDRVKSYTEIYAKFTGGSDAILLPGKEFNEMLKKLAGSTAAYNINDTKIRQIIRTGSIDEGIVTTGSISTSYSDKEIVARYKSGIVYYYTDAETIKMNGDSSYMFYYMQGLTGLDLSSWNTSNVTNMSSMFGGCSKIETIYVGTGFTVNKIINSSNMFAGTSKLIGGNGTTYNTGYTDKEYARIDKNGQIGYFTDKNEITVRFMVYPEVYENQRVTYGTTAIRPVNSPTKSGLELKSWMTSNCNEYDFDNDLIYKYTEIYAAFKSDEAILLPGKEFNAAVKKLAGTNDGYNSRNTNIKQIIQTGSIPEGVTTGVLSLPYSDNYVIAWYKSGIVYYYTDAKTIYLNPDSSYMFYRFGGLTGLNVTNWDTSKVTDMKSMFYECDELESIDVSGWDTSNVIDMSSMFLNCESLTEIDVSNWNVSKVMNMYYMFGFCKKLTSLDLSNWDTRNVMDMSFMFRGCFDLADLNLNGLNTSKVTTMRYMFDACTSLTELDLSDWDTRSVTDLYVTFKECTNLTKLDLSNWDTSNVTTMNNMFMSCNNLEELNLSGWDFRKYNTRWWKSNVSLGSLSLKKLNMTNAKFSGSMEQAFEYNCSMEELVLDGVDTSNVTNMNRMFYHCNSLKELDLSSFDTSNVEDMGYMFYYCSGLTQLDISHFDTSKVTNMYDMFYNCKSLTSLNLSSFNTSNVTNMRDMFGACSSLETIFASTGFTTNKISNNSMFYNDINLVGGNGTRFDPNYIDKEYARIDGRNGLSGYFTYIITLDFDSNGGTLVDSQKFKSGLTGTKPTDPTKTGHSFLGRYTDDDQEFDFSQPIFEPTKLYAKWQVKQYTITFDTNGGDVMNSIDINYGDNIFVPSPTKNGYRFIGWEPTLPITMPAENLSVKAKWEKINGGSSGGGGGGGGGSTKPDTSKEEQKPADTSEQVPQNDNSASSGANVKTPEDDTQKDSQIGEQSSSEQLEGQGNGRSNTSDNLYTNEQKEAYEFAKENGITTMATIQKADMSGKLTRIQMAKMLSQYAINVLGQTPDTSKTIKFVDVTDKRDADYDNGVTLAYQLGIMGQNMKDNKFRPNDEVTRAEFVTALSRLLYSTSDGEYKSTSKYYTHHMEKLVSEGIITKADPSMKERRGYVMIMLMRSVK